MAPNILAENACPSAIEMDTKFKQILVTFYMVDLLKFT
jgi:hypothetical protein